MLLSIWMDHCLSFAFFFPFLSFSGLLFLIFTFFLFFLLLFNSATTVNFDMYGYGIQHGLGLLLAAE